MGADWIEERYRQAGMIPQWVDYCGNCGSHENVWLIDMEEPWKYVDGRRRQAPGLSSYYLDTLSYEQREDFLSKVGHTSTGVLCQICIDKQLAEAPYVKDGIWTGRKKVTRYVRKLSSQ